MLSIKTKSSMLKLLAYSKIISNQREQLDNQLNLKIEDTIRNVNGHILEMKVQEKYEDIESLLNEHCLEEIEMIHMKIEEEWLHLELTTMDSHSNSLHCRISKSRQYFNR